MDFRSIKMAAIAVACISVTSEANAQENSVQQCATNVRIISVSQGPDAITNPSDIAITVKSTDGSTQKFATINYGNTALNAQVRTLLTMALAALSSQMPVNVYAENCGNTDGPYVEKWKGLTISAN